MLKNEVAIIGAGLGGTTVAYGFQQRNYNAALINGSTQDNETLPDAKNVMVLEEYDMKIPCLTWMDILFEDMREIYNYLRAKSENDAKELKRLTEKYGLDKVPEEEIPLCISQGSYELYVQWKKEEEELFANELMSIS